MKRILFGLLVIILLSGCEFNLGNIEKEQNKIEEIAVDSDIVKSIDSVFKITDVLAPTSYKIALDNATSMIKEDKNCDAIEFEDVMYNCKYISYDDLNVAYKKLYGGDILKIDLFYFGVNMLKYDRNAQVYRLCEFMGGGGGLYKVSKIVKAEMDNDNVYIYERTFSHSEILGEEGKEQMVSIFFKHTDENEGLEIFINYDELETFKEKHINKFDLYKWTFKKNADGTYTNLDKEYVEL